MKLNKKVATFALCALAAVSMLATVGCGSDKKADEVKVLKVGMECGYAPYNWSQTTNENNAVKIAGTSEYASGYDVMMAQKVADSMGRKLEIHKIDWNGLAPAVISGKIDAVLAGMSITNKRKLSVDFSNPYYYASVVTITTKDSKYATAKGLSDLKGAKVTSQMNTVWYTKMVDQIPEVNKLAAISTVPSMVVALTSGKVDLLVADLPAAMAAQASNPELVILDFTGQKDNYDFNNEDVEIGAAIKKGNKELAEGINKALKGMTQEDFKKVMAKAIANQPMAGK